MFTLHSSALIHFYTVYCVFTMVHPQAHVSTGKTEGKKKKINKRLFNQENGHLFRAVLVRLNRNEWIGRRGYT